MKLSNVLSLVNQVEKSKFINAIDRLCSDAVKHDKKIAAQLNKLDGQIKDASSTDITQLFKIVLPYFEKSVREQLAMLGAQATLLTNILSRDGNCIARINWIESLYAKEWAIIDKIENPPFGFENFILQHFKFKKSEILETANMWLDESISKKQEMQECIENLKEIYKKLEE